MQSGPSRSLLDVQLFGRFRITIDGQTVEDSRWERRSAKRLVKLLALAPSHTLHREQIIERLWPRQDARAGPNSLNKAIHGARRALEPDLVKGPQSRFILTSGNQVTLASPGGPTVDVHRFETAAKAAIREKDAVAARNALALYGGSLLLDDLYEAWTFAHRDALRQLFRTTSTAAARLFVQRGDPAPGIEIALRLVQDDPSDEPARQLLLQLQAASGHEGHAVAPLDPARGALGPPGVAMAPGDAGLDGGPGSGEAAPPVAAPTAPAEPAVVVWSPHIVPATFRPGVFSSARWLPDGRSVLITALWDDATPGLYRIVPETGDVDRLPWRDARLLAVSTRGELALGLNRRMRNPVIDRCTLAIVPAAGDTATALADEVLCADWRPDAGPARIVSLRLRLAVAREVDGRTRVEFPLGTVVYESMGWISHLRFSPDGRQIAFIDHPIENDDEGDVRILDVEDAARGARKLASHFMSARGLAWIDDDVWVTAARKGGRRSLLRLRPDGSEILMSQDLGNLTLHDAGPTRRLLVAAEHQVVGTMARHASAPQERNISWHGLTTPRDISADGQWLLVEEGHAPGRHPIKGYLRRIDGSSTRAIADGAPLALSPDQRTVILKTPATRSGLTVLDLETGLARKLANHPARPLLHNEFVSYFPDGRRIAFSATDPSGSLRIYLQNLARGTPVCFTPDQAGLRMPWNRAVSPDGRWIVLLGPDDRMRLHALDGSGTRTLGDLGSEYRLACWHDNGKELFVYGVRGVPARVYRYDLVSGAMSEWLALSPHGVGTVQSIRRLRMTGDGLSYAYAFTRETSDLYVFDDF